MLLLQISLIVILLVWIAAMVMAYQYGRLGRLLTRRESSVSAPAAELPPLSVVICTHNHAVALRQHLPAILEQDYDNFEVIVVDAASDDETKDVLERLEFQYSNLRHTFTPTSARDISIERLAIMLGFRAASHEWIVLTRPDCEPQSQQWLLRIGETIASPQSSLQSPRLQQPDMVIGLTRYDLQRSTGLDNQSSFHRLYHLMALVQHILDGHAAVTADRCNLAFRKSFFMEQGGFSESQNLKGGAVELLVNHTSTPTNTALMLAPSGMMIQDRLGDHHRWKKQRVFYAETQRHQHHITLYRFKQFWRYLLPWLTVLFLVLPLLLCIALTTAQIDIAGIPAVVPALLLTLLFVALAAVKITQFQLTTRALGYRSYTLSLLLLELRLLLWDLSARFSRRLTSPNEFRKKFV